MSARASASKITLAALCALSFLTAFGDLEVMASDLIEPRMRVHTPTVKPPIVALTLDACGGMVDDRILNMLVSARIPATIFASGRWIRKNPEALLVVRAHPELFEVENHGNNHRPAIDRKMAIYGLSAAGSPDEVRKEIEDGAAAVFKATGRQPLWFRGAAAEYTQSSLKQIKAMNIRVAGFSIAADGGGLSGSKATRQRILSAKHGDILLAHLNKPKNPAGSGVVEGILELQKKGYVFVKLSDATLNIY